MKYPFFSLSSLLLLGTCISCNQKENPAEDKKGKLTRPNVLFLFADDQ